MSRLPLMLAALSLASAALPLHAQREPGLLVTPQWVREHQRDPNLVLLHVGPRESFDKEHIAGARFVAMELLAVREPTPLEMPAPDSLRHALESLGISDRSRVVVVFSDEWVSPSTRVIYTLTVAGLGDRTSLLDGGLAEWKRAGLPVTAEVSAIARGRVTTKPQAGLIVDHAFMQANRDVPGVRLVDARTPQFYSGPDITTARGVQAVGHIAGARNIPFNSVWDDSNRVLPKAQLLQMFKAAGISPGDTVVAYCHIGQQATALLFAARSAGFTTRLYDGSMADWGKRQLPLVKTP